MTEITHENVVSMLQNMQNEMSVIESRLNELDLSIPDSELELLTLEHELVIETDSLPELIEFCAKQKPDPVMIGGRLKNCFTGLTRLMGICTEHRKKYIERTGKKLPLRIKDL